MRLFSFLAPRVDAALVAVGSVTALLLAGPRVGLPSPAAAGEAPFSTAEVGRTGEVDDLLARLAASEDDAEAASLRRRLARAWATSGSAGADLLLGRAAALDAAGEWRGALATIEAVLRLEPRWSEARRVRAGLQMKHGDYAAAKVDLIRALEQNDRDFRLIDTLAVLEIRDGRSREALVLLRRAAAIDPRDGGRAKAIEKLAVSVEGHDL